MCAHTNSLHELDKSRTATEMDGTLQTDFRKSETSRDIKKYFELLSKLYKFSKLGGCGSKITPATSILVLEYM